MPSCSGSRPSTITSWHHAQTMRLAMVSTSPIRVGIGARRRPAPRPRDIRLQTGTMIARKLAHRMPTIKLVPHPSSAPAIPSSERAPCSNLSAARITGGDYNLQCPSCNFLVGEWVNPEDLLFEALKCPCCKTLCWLVAFDSVRREPG